MIKLNNIREECDKNRRSRIVNFISLYFNWIEYLNLDKRDRGFESFSIILIFFFIFIFLFKRKSLYLLKFKI